MTIASQGAQRVGVLGAGAIGLLYAASLAERLPGQITLITRRAALCDALANGVTVLRPSEVKAPDSAQASIPANSAGRIQHGLRVTTDAALANATDEADADTQAFERRFDLLLITVAAYDTASNLPLIARLLHPHGLCITLQNGLDSAPLLSEHLGAARVLQGVTTFAAHLEAPDVVQIDSAGTTRLPALPVAHQHWLSTFQEAGLNPQILENALEAAWLKMATGTSGVLSLILARPVGRIRHSPAVRALVTLAAMETADIAAAHGVMLDRAALRAQLERVWNTLDDSARASLYSALMAGRKTEIEERLGSLVRRAAATGVAAPTLGLLYQMAQARLEVGVAQGELDT